METTAHADFNSELEAFSLVDEEINDADDYSNSNDNNDNGIERRRSSTFLQFPHCAENWSLTCILKWPVAIVCKLREHIGRLPRAICRVQRDEKGQLSCYA